MIIATINKNSAYKSKKTLNSDSPWKYMQAGRTYSALKESKTSCEKGTWTIMENFMTRHKEALNY